MRTASIIVTLAIMLTWTLAARAADEPKADSPAPTAVKQPAAKPGPQAEQFAKLFTEWKALLVDLNDMKVKFRSAEGQAKTDIEDRWKVQIAKATEMQDKLIETAEKAYVESPEADANITDMLLGLVFTWNQHDDYEKSFRMAKLLLDNGCKDTNLPEQAGIAAFGIGEFELAKKWLAAGPAAQLSEAGQKAVMGQQYYGQVWAKEQKLREAEAKADDLPRVLLKTSKGEIEIELFENEAPNTVANFITLVDKGFYNGLKFHRVLEGFMAQGGCPKGDGTGGPGYNIPCECVKPEHRLHFRGTLSMAKTALPDTGGSQFFLCFVPLQMLDGKHTVFGRVVRGMDVLAKIRRIDPEQPTGVQPDKIIEAKVLRKRPHEYKVEKAAGRE